MAKEVMKLNIIDSINHALFISQALLEILLDKGIITDKEYEEKYKSMIETYREAVMPEPEFEPFNAEKYLKEGI